MLKSRGLWIRENTELPECYSEYFNVHAVATLKKGKHLKEMKGVKDVVSSCQKLYISK